jgi:hypothetical protein
MSTKHEWYSADGWIIDDYPRQERDGHPLQTSGQLSVFNPGEAQAARVKLVLFHEEEEPTQYSFEAPPAGRGVVTLHDLEAVGPRNRWFGMQVTADAPVADGPLPVAQYAIHYYRPYERVPEASLSMVMFPGPLDGHTEWYFPDGWMGGPGKMSWYEREVLSILNPGDQEVRVTATFYSEGVGRDHEFVVPGRRVFPLGLYDLPVCQWRNEDPDWPTARMVQFETRLVSSGPIVAQKTRRAYRPHESTIQGMWSAFGYPAHL